MVERLIFVGTNKPQSLESFIRSVNLSSLSPLPDEPPRNQLLFLADQRRLSLNKNSEESNLPILVIDDRIEQLLRTAQAMLNDDNEVVRQAIENLSGALCLVKLEANTSSSIVDRETGIRVVGIMKGQSAFPMHPTPAS